MVEIVNRQKIMTQAAESEKGEVSRLLSLGVEAVEAADGYKCVRKALTYEGTTLRVIDREGHTREYDLRDYQGIYVLGFGKAAEPMARAVYDVLDDEIEGGVILVRSGKRKKAFLGRIEVLEGAHPVPTEEGYNNARKLTNFLKEAPKEKSLYLFLISGGGSSLYADFHPDIPFGDGVNLNDLLIHTNATIQEINAVRKHTAEGKGGQLAKLLEGADVLSVIVSDVPGNDVGTIASGPLSPDSTRFQDAKVVLGKYGLWFKVPESVRQRILRGVRGEVAELPAPGDSCFDKVHHCIAADALTSCDAVKEKIKELYGEYPARVLPCVREGKVTIELARVLLEDSQPGFTIRGHEYAFGVDPKKSKEGGRQLHLLLLMLKVMKQTQEHGMYVMGVATDGKDGNSWAGALITPSLITGTDLEEIERAEEEKNSGGFFREKGYLIRMKSDYGLDDTGTNVNNLLIIHNPVHDQQ